MRRVVIDLGSPRPVWRVPPTTIRAIRTAFGRGWTVSRIRAEASSDGDGGTGSRESQQRVAGAEVYMGWGIPVGVARAGTATLRWVHSAAAGVGASITPELQATRAIFTNSRGIQAEPMADWVVAAVGSCLRGFHVALTAQRAHRWAKDEFTDGTVTVRDFHATRVGIVGLGGIGRAVAWRCAALGMVVRGIRRHPGRRRPRGVAWVGGPRDLVRLARQSDVLVITAPHTVETEHLIDDRVLRALPDRAFLVNVARGAIVDEDALCRHLDDGHVAGCVLDVFAKEPLPRRHRFWDHPGVMVFPHSSAVSDRFWERQTALLVENVRRYLTGRRLANVVDLEAGY